MIIRTRDLLMKPIASITPKVKKQELNSRIKGALFLVTFVFFFLVYRLFQISVLRNNYYIALARDQQIITTEISPKRGSIFSNDILNKAGRSILAESLERFALLVTPKNVPEEEQDKIATILDDYVEDKDKNGIIEVLKRDSMYAPPLIHNLSQKQVEEIGQKVNPKIALNFDETAGDLIYFSDGIIFLREFKRFYPEDNLASHLLGFVDNEGNGQYGVESFNNKELRGSRGTVALEKDNSGEVLSQIGSIQTKDGWSLVLTIDHNIQSYTEKRLTKAISDYQAESGTIIILDPKTGAILALASQPDYNPNDFAKTSYDKFVNRAISQQYEAGSVMKPFTVSAALDLGLVKPEDTNDFPASLTIGSYTINNVADHSYPGANITGILDNSINTGTVWLADKLGNQDFYDYLKNFGFGAKTNIELPSEITGDLPDVQKWRDIHRATISFGQGHAVTPIQLVSGYGAIANNGELLKPYIIKEKFGANGRVETEKQVVRQVITPETAKTVRDMLRHVVEFGHARHAEVKGYSIGGKTGTAQIPLPDGGYSETETIQTFVGMGPTDEPKFVIGVILEKPKNAIFADSSTVYVFSDIAKFIFNYWQIPPDKQ